MKLANPSVRLGDLTSAMLMGLLLLKETYRQYAPEMDFVVTSIDDGLHMVGSLHYKGNAADIRVHGLTKEQAEKILQVYNFSYHRDFDLVLEDWDTPNAHYHCEYDPKDA